METRRITQATAKRVFQRMVDSGESPLTIIEADGLWRITDPREIAGALDLAISQTPKAIVAWRSGQEKALDATLGMLIKNTRGRIDPSLARDALRVRLCGQPGKSE